MKYIVYSYWYAEASGVVSSSFNIEMLVWDSSLESGVLSNEETIILNIGPSQFYTVVKMAARYCILHCNI